MFVGVKQTCFEDFMSVYTYNSINMIVKYSSIIFICRSYPFLKDLVIRDREIHRGRKRERERLIALLYHLCSLPPACGDQGFEPRSVHNVMHTLN